MLTPETLPAVQAALSDAGVDGWLLFDFRGINPISQALLRAEGLQSRRMFAWIPRRGTPVAIVHAIEPGSWVHWPAAWDRRVYASWKSLEAELSALVRGKRVAMEYSPGDAVPVVDRVPAGVLEMVRAAGATVVTSADLVSRFFAVWTRSQLESHRRAAEIIARIAKEAFARAGASVRGGTPMAEHELMLWIQRQFTAGGLSTDHGPNVSATENAANPHYEPSPEAPRVLRQGDCVLIDLWAVEPGGIYADQTWMASIGAPSPKLQLVW
ncbi:MAG: M24 family metallopeptidase, partial [Gemmatimonadales bacterium]